MCATCPRPRSSYRSESRLSNLAEMLQLKTAGPLYAERDKFGRRSHSAETLAVGPHNFHCITEISAASPYLQKLRGMTDGCHCRQARAQK